MRPSVLVAIAMLPLAACTALPDRSAGGESLRVEDRGAQSGPSVVPGGTFRAAGNEPPWLVTVDEDEMVLVTDYGARSRRFHVLDTERDRGVTRHWATDGEQVLVMTVRRELCNDSMSGMPHPHAVELVSAQAVLRGCGGEPIDLLAGREWEVTLLDGQVPVSGSRITLRFYPEDGRVAGRASCNHFNAAYTLTGEHLRFSRPMGTLMACPEPLMTQEREFLRLLTGVRAFAIDRDGMLELIGEGRLVAKPLPLAE